MRRVGVTREGEGAARLADRLARHGLDPVVVPLIARTDAADGGAALRAAVAAVGPGEWIAVTSPNGAAAVADARPPSGMP